ncbi:apolipoprotein N-acyltransferase [Sphingomonas nostoxanthinifaciens]|uniref:apolipoprotein N-acyltransferase n=1 Tax=Sphingomonas nostoxanthinifaciens TaxID=2872652 RepID=UPI001CC213A0|nr:apolipoprotein N-acyltransferase [Sphingomonas nostoxanthinifaciens]UAK24980.1 apolipoprotein N-acyltransferase [Sphingomonas nostoxanthinifaciens]
MPHRALHALPLAFAAGLLAACGFAPLELWPLSLICLAGLILLLERATTLARAVALGWWFGFGSFCLGLNWIATAFTYQAAMPAWLGIVAVVLLSLYLAVYPAFATGAAWALTRVVPGRWPLVLFLAATWIANEWLRATVFTGFAWNPLAAMWAPLWPLAGIVALVGTYGLSGLTLLLAGVLPMAVRGLRDGFVQAELGQRRGRAVILAAVGGAIAFACVSLFVPLMAVEPKADPTAPLLHVVQPNIGQAEKWSPDAEARNFARLASLSGTPGLRPRLILWPEVAVPAFLEEDPAARAQIASLLGPHDLMLTGAEAIQYDSAGQIVSATNSLFGLDPQGRLLGRYDKSHLVPYGEYLPMRPILSRIGLSRLAPGDMDFLAGPGPRDLTLPGIGAVGVQICYEIIFSGHVVDEAHRPRFLFNPSNDAWFGRWGPPQHLAQARLRAIEEGVPVVRATPTGISAIVDAHGRLLASLPWRTPGAIEQPLPRTAPPTLFSRWGNFLSGGLALVLLLIGFASRRRAG